MVQHSLTKTILHQSCKDGSKGRGGHTVPRCIPIPFCWNDVRSIKIATPFFSPLLQASIITVWRKKLRYWGTISFPYYDLVSIPCLFVFILNSLDIGVQLLPCQPAYLRQSVHWRWWLYQRSKVAFVGFEGERESWNSDFRIWFGQLWCR